MRFPRETGRASWRGVSQGPFSILETLRERERWEWDRGMCNWIVALIPKGFPFPPPFPLLAVLPFPVAQTVDLPSLLSSFSTDFTYKSLKWDKSCSASSLLKGQYYFLLKWFESRLAVDVTPSLVPAELLWFVYTGFVCLDLTHSHKKVDKIIYGSQGTNPLKQLKKEKESTAWFSIH